MINNRFALSDLEFKDVNIDTELSTSDVLIKDTSILKKLTGGRKQPTRIEQKYQHVYDVYIHAKLFFNANIIVQFPNPTAADYRREIIISFPNTFEGKKDDPHLLDKLASKEEVSGIFNVLMKALRHILKDNRLFFNEKTIEERMLKHERIEDSVKAFIEEAIVEDSISSYMIKSELYNAFLTYCKNYSIPPKTKEALGKYLKKIGWEEGKVSKDGKRRTVWFGVRLKSEYAVKEQQQQQEEKQQQVVTSFS